jgi:hypothetical protein
LLLAVAASLLAAWHIGVGKVAVAAAVALCAAYAGRGAGTEEEDDDDDEEEDEESVWEKELTKTHARMRSFTERAGTATLHGAREESAAENRE